MYEEFKKCTGTVTTAKNEVFLLGYNMKIVIWWGDKPLVGGNKNWGDFSCWGWEMSKFSDSGGISPISPSRENPVLWKSPYSLMPFGKPCTQRLID